MTKTINRLPAILLAVIIAAALSFVVWGAQQPAYAEDGAILGPEVMVTESGYGYGVPGQTIEMKAELHYVSPEVKAHPDLRWELSEGGDQFADLVQDPTDPLKATLTFKEFTQTKIEPMFSYRAVLMVDGKKISSDDIQQVLVDEYTVPVYDKDFLVNVSGLLPGESTSMSMKVLHFDRDNTSGKEVRATYEWNYNEEDVQITPPECTDGKATVKRLSSEETEFMLTTSWEGGDEQLWFSFEPVDYNLEDYQIVTSLGEYAWDAVIPEGTSMSKDTLKPQVKTPHGDILPEEFYDLEVKKSRGWNSIIFDYDFEDASFPLTLNEKNHVDETDTPDGGTALYRLIAKGKNGYKGETTMDLMLYSDHSLNYWATTVEYDKDITLIDEPPYLLYEVPQGETLLPKKIYIGDYDNPIELKPGETCKIEYENYITGEVQSDFPKELGVYKVVVSGIEPYYGSNAADEIDFIKVGKKNTMTAKANKLTAKNNKKMTFSAKKAFTVKKAKGAVTYEKTKGDKHITVAKNGKVTVKKGLKKGKTYSVKVRVKSDGDRTYLSASKTVTLKVKVK